jgi:hypothetical protein
MAVGTVANSTVEGAANIQELNAATNDAVVEEESQVSADKGVPRMTPDMILDLCIKNQGWSAPELNDFLMLHYKGFRKIENLEPYVNVKTIWLECNGISRIEGLEVIPGLHSLYLQSNCISRIDNLAGLTSLQHLNLAHNSISQVEGLEHLRSLETINLSSNKITDVAGLQGLVERPSLRSVDVSQNYIEDGDAYLDFWEKAIPEVQCLYLHRNPCSRALKDYRRRLVSSLTKLRWIDERPVSELERVGAEAWAGGGKDAENEAKRQHFLQEREEKERSFKQFQRMSQASAARIQAQKAAQAARDSAREEAAAQLEQTGSLAEGWVASEMRSSAPSAEASVAPTQQSELRMKVEAFLSNRTRSEDRADASMHSADTGDNQATRNEPEKSEHLRVAEAEVDAQSKPHGGPAEDGVASRVPDLSDVEELMPQQEEFTWTNFREKRLGRLAAECRYDFQKVALRLSEEFSCSVTVDACRQQYRMLMKPSVGRDRRKEDSGRARDAPDMDPAEVQEVSKWWVRQIATGSHPSRKPAAAPVLEPIATSVCVPTQIENPRDGLLDLDSLEECVSASRGGTAALSDSMASALGDMQRYTDFVPPVRPAEVESVSVGADAASHNSGQGSLPCGTTTARADLLELD